MTGRGFAASRVVTCDPARAGTLGIIEQGAVVVEGGRIAFVGERSAAPADVTLVDLGSRVITPGLVDAHTHACWAGSRHLEYAMRSAGRDPRDIAQAGGGIMATHGAVVSATVKELADGLAARLRRMASLGVTTVEVKSGYGLDADNERKQLEAIAVARGRPDLPEVVPTLLALHALPAGVERAEYVARVAFGLIPQVARERLALFVDACVDAHAFTADEARVVGEAALQVGLGVRFHVGQFADVGGAKLAASLGATSVDHLEHVSAGGVKALAQAGVTVVLLPLTNLTLDQPPPPIAFLREAGVRLVVASDANPGTAPSESLPLALALAVLRWPLSADEALLGATRHAAAALTLPDRGVLREGLRADLVAWDLPHEHAILQPWGVSKTSVVMVGGRVL
jgi:imidazolonepropionase